MPGFALFLLGKVPVFQAFSCLAANQLTLGESSP